MRRRRGEIVAWSRILDDEEALCVLNPHGSESRGADVVVDASLNPPGSTVTVALNTSEAAPSQGYAESHPSGSILPVHRTTDGTAYVEIRDVGSSEVLVVTTYPEAEERRITVIG